MLLILGPLSLARHNRVLVAQTSFMILEVAMFSLQNPVAQSARPSTTTRQPQQLASSQLPSHSLRWVMAPQSLRAS